MPEHRAICAPRRVICGSRCSTLRSLDTEPGKSFMPSVNGILSDADLNDLIAYLASRKGAQ